jgi:2-keto-myo-inositol isomerase
MADPRQVVSRGPGARRGGLYLNGATVMTTPTDRQLVIAREAGFSGIEARAERLVGAADELRASVAAADHGEVWSLNGVRLGLRPDGAPELETLKAEMAPRLEICRALGAPYLLAVPARVPGLEARRGLPGTREGLARARDLAAASGVRIAFEFLGFPDCPIRTPPLAGEVVGGVDGVDLILDVAHWHASGSPSLRDGFPVERLAMVHLNDLPDKPLAELEDADRLFPLEGVIRLADLMRDLTVHRYAGPVSLETFNPAHWAADPLDLARRGLEAVKTLVGESVTSLGRG